MSLQQLGSLPWLRFDPQPGNFHMLWVQPKEKKKKKNFNNTFATTWIDLERVTFREISQRQILYDVMYMWNPKQNPPNTHTTPDSQMQRTD